MYISLRQAKLEEFQVGPDIVLTPQLGQPLTLDCVHPESVPPANIFWAIRKMDGGFDAVNYDARVSMDEQYRLRFTNVNQSDEMSGRAYTCTAWNSILRKATQGPQYIINPEAGNGDLMPVSYLVASPEDHFGIHGDNFSLKCIFAGNPTPDVHWERTDGTPLQDRAIIQPFGQELMIANLQFNDSGLYECWATNTVSTTRVQRTISVHVESVPFWLQEPQDVEIDVGGTAEFNCLAKANPEPAYLWYINGVPLQSVTDPRIDNVRFHRPEPNRIVFENLTREDSMVLQCNASNKHGSIWGDVYLNVFLGEAPTIINSPQNRTIVAEGTPVNLTCRVTGKPDPVITWFKDTQQITGVRYEIQISGDLLIRQVVLSDAGLYRCEAENEYNKTSAQGLLVVAPIDGPTSAATPAATETSEAAITVCPFFRWLTLLSLCSVFSLCVSYMT